MPSYQDFAKRARERFQAREARKENGGGEFLYTEHARYKMRQYRLSEQKVRGVVRRPARTEQGVAPKTIAVMQAVSPKKENGKEVWKQEIWVMYQEKKKAGPLAPAQKRIISAWRYPGISPKRDPVPAEIWRELTEGDILDPFE